MQRSLLTAGIPSMSSDTAQGAWQFVYTEPPLSAHLVVCSCVLGRTKAEVADLVMEHLQILFLYK